MTHADLRRRCATTFEREYAVLFERPIPGAAIEVVELVGADRDQGRARASRDRASAEVARAPRRQGSGSRAFFDGRAGRIIDVPLYRRERMAAGRALPGPAMIAEDETSTFVTASFDCAYRWRRRASCMERKAA